MTRRQKMYLAAAALMFLISMLLLFFSPTPATASVFSYWEQ